MRLLASILLAIIAAFCALLAYDSLLPPISTLMVERTFSGESVTRRFLPLAHISPTLIRSVIAAEDGKFCTHHGVDWKALNTVVKDVAEEGEASRGASTITMQTTKNLFLWNAHSFVRKGLEIPLALGLDAIWSKRHIMETYLNIAEFGPGIFGADAAAHHYFHKSASALSPREAALLTATLPNPKRRNPANPSGYMSSYAASIEARAWQQETRCMK